MKPEVADKSPWNNISLSLSCIPFGKLLCQDVYLADQIMQAFNIGFRVLFKNIANFFFSEHSLGFSFKNPE